MASIDTSFAEVLDITTYKNDSFSLIMTVKDSDDSDYDFTGYSASCKVYSGTTEILEITVALATGQITLSKDAGDMNITAGKYHYDLQITYDTGEVRTWLKGKFIIETESTT